MGYSVSLSFLVCQVTYCFIFSSSRPTVLTQYPCAQKCRPQYRFFSSICLSNIFMALLPFRNPTTSDTAYFGGKDSTRCTWSTCTFPANISMFFHWHNCRRIARTVFAISPLSILKRYFGHQTTWYLHSHTACDSLLNRFITCLLVIFRATTHIIRRLFICRNLYATCIAQLGPIRIADGLWEYNKAECMIFN